MVYVASFDILNKRDRLIFLYSLWLSILSSLKIFLSITMSLKTSHSQDFRINRYQIEFFLLLLKQNKANKIQTVRWWLSVLECLLCKHECLRMEPMLKNQAWVLVPPTPAFRGRERWGPGSYCPSWNAQLQIYWRTLS